MRFCGPSGQSPGQDISVSARTRAGFTLQGGLSTGRTSTDNCDLYAKLPEVSLQFGIIAVPPSQCHVDTNFLTQFKLLGTYLVPNDILLGRVVGVGMLVRW